MTWAEASLEELGVEAQSGFPSGKHNQTGAGIPHLRPMNVSRDGRIELGVVKYVTPDRELRIRPGDVLFNNTNSPPLVGKTAHFDRPGEFAFSNHMTRLRSREGLDSKFLALQLHTFWNRGVFQAMCTKHVNQASISTKPLLSLRIALPPLAEQRRIVATIEEQFSRLDAASVSLDRQLRRLHVLKTSLMESALDGGWPLHLLDELVSSLRNGTFVSRPAVAPPGTRIFRISAVRPMSLNTEDVRYAPGEPNGYEGFFVEEGDLLFTRYSGNPDYVGACARVPKLAERTLHPDKLIRVVPDRSRIEPAFLELACSAGSTADGIRKRRKTTAGQVGIAGSQLRTVRVPVPPLADQRRIVVELEQQLSLIDALRAAVEAAQKRSAALRRAILERAFRGELVPQDPADEPACVLLERIRANRAAEPPRSTRRRATMETS